jgi:predicted metal-dependent hydrolase
MAFDSEKWALSFYGVVDEKLAVETDVFNLHVYRKQDIKKLQAERSFGKLDIYIPGGWDMEEYGNQEKMRKFMSKEIEWQASNIYQQRTNLIAGRIGLPDIKVSVGNKGTKDGSFNHEENHVYFNMWTICSYQSKYMDHMISHELAHYYVHNHSEEFWNKLDDIYFSLYNRDDFKEDYRLQISRKSDPYQIYILLRSWARPSGLKAFYSSSHIKDKKTFLHPVYIKNKSGQVVIRWFLRR